MSGYDWQDRSVRNNSGRDGSIAPGVRSRPTNSGSTSSPPGPSAPGRDDDGPQPGHPAAIVLAVVGGGSGVLGAQTGLSRVVGQALPADGRPADVAPIAVQNVKGREFI